MFKIYKTYYRFLLRYRWSFLAFGLALIGFGVFDGVQPYFYKLFVESIDGGSQSLLVRILVVYLLVRLSSLVSSMLVYYFGDRIVFAGARDARMAIFKKIQDLDFAFHLSKSTGSLISIMKRGDSAFFDLHHSININLSLILVQFLVLLFFLVRVNWLVAGLMLLSLGINLFLTRFLVRINIRTRRDFNKEEDRISGTIVDNLINFETVKLFAKEDWEYKRLGKQFVEWMKKLWLYSYSFRLIDIVVGGLGNASLFLVLLLSLHQVFALRLTPGDYVMIVGFVSSFYYSFFEMVWGLRSLAKSQADIEKYLGILNQETKVKDPKKAVKKTSVEGQIEFRKLSFAYPSTKNLALKDISLTIRPGQSVAFVGHSGTGKTTLIKLLMRFYDPTKGGIYLDGIDIKRFNKDQLRSFMGVVPQEPILFNKSIAYNISYGRGKVSQRELLAAAKMANLDEFIDSLPKGYKTIVGERGVKLSGGQKQRLAIARMILSDPDIVIFDEATSQLDSDSEKKIQEAFWKAVKNKTTLIIAHRLSTVAKAEKIVVMENGEIKEVGSHRQLLAKKDGLYAHFWQLQSSTDL
ncbi:MAG: ABC transporter ATP-binding protein [Patescibacteria group bacterium]